MAPYISWETMDDLPHARLIALASDVEILSSERGQVLVQINSLRNRYAHAIRYHPEVSELKSLFSAATFAFTDYSNGIEDALVELGAGRAFDIQNGWLMAELFLAIVYDLHREFVSRGGDEEHPDSLTGALDEDEGHHA